MGEKEGDGRGKERQRKYSVMVTVLYFTFKTGVWTFPESYSMVFSQYT